MSGKPSGPIAFAGSVTGSADRPDVAVSISGDRLAWAGVRDVWLRSTAAWHSGVLDITELTLRMAGGEAIGQAHVSIGRGKGGGDLRLAWHRLPLAAFEPAIRSHLPIRLTAAMDGHLEARWTEPRVDTLTLSIENHAQGVSSAGRLGVQGLVALDVRAGRWNARLDDLLGGALRIAGSANGRVSSDDFSASTLSGDVVVSAAACIRLLGRS